MAFIALVCDAAFALSLVSLLALAMGVVGAHGRRVRELGLCQVAMAPNNEVADLLHRDRDAALPPFAQAAVLILADLILLRPVPIPDLLSRARLLQACGVFRSYPVGVPDALALASVGEALTRGGLRFRPPL